MGLGSLASERLFKKPRHPIYLWLLITHPMFPETTITALATISSSLESETNHKASCSIILGQKLMSVSLIMIALLESVTALQVHEPSQIH